MSGTVYDEHISHYLDFLDRAMAAEPSLFRIMLGIVERLLGPRIEGARVCDIACGEGYLSRFVRELGAKEVAAIDSSAELIAEAGRRTEGAGISYQVDDAQKLEKLSDSSYDVAVSQMAMMDIADHRAAFEGIARVLEPGGLFVFSLLHPCFEAPYHVPDEPQFLVDAEGAPTAVAVRYYASEGYWKSGATGVRGQMGSHHRMLSTYLNDLLAAGFRLDRIEEPLVEGAGLASQVPRVLVVAATLVS